MKNYEQIAEQGPLITKGALTDALQSLYGTLKGSGKQALSSETRQYINALYVLQNETDNQKNTEEALRTLRGLNKFLHTVIDEEKGTTICEWCEKQLSFGKSNLSSDLNKLNQYLDLGLSEDVLEPPKNIRQGRRPADPNSIKIAPNGISLEQYSDLVRAHHDKRHLARPSDDQIAGEYNRMKDDQLKAKYDEYLSQNRLYWEKSLLKGMPRWVLNTGKPDELNTYLEQNREQLSYEQQFLLRDRARVTNLYREAAGKAQEKQQQGLQLNQTQPPEYNGTAVELKSAHQKSFQTSGNGCWSCFMQIAASSRGVDITQEDLRSYRPELDKEDAKKLSGQTYIAYNTDYRNNFMDRADTLLNLVPNTKVHELQITGYNQQAINRGISKEQYLEGAMNQIKKTLRSRSRPARSPAAATSA